MGLDRTFSIIAETKDRKPILNQTLADSAQEAIERRYGQWDGGLYEYNAMSIYGVNWWDWHDDMIAVSKEFPNLIFTVECLGMGMEDTWIAYYCDGRYSGGNAEFPEPDYDYLLYGIKSVTQSINVTQYEMQLIYEALNNLRESREDELRWAGDDKDIIEADTNCINDINDLLNRVAWIK